MRWCAMILLAAASCGDPSTMATADAAGVEAAEAGATVDASAAVDGPLSVVDLPGAFFDTASVVSPLAQGVYRFTLDAGAFPPTSAHPSALVYVPSGFDATPPLAVVVYLHGWSNCVENVIRDAGQPCTPGGPTRNAYALAAQLEASHKNALLLCPETLVDQMSGAAGSLDQPGGLAALLDETLRDLASRTGHAPLGAADVGQLMLLSHSGGYGAAASIVRQGGITVEELDLLDSLYGNFADFDAWVKRDLPSLAAVTRRFADIYTCCGGTEADSQAMAARARGWVDAGSLVDDRTSSTWADATYRHGVLFKLSSLSHDGVPRYYFGELVRTSSLPDKR